MDMREWRNRRLRGLTVAALLTTAVSAPTAGQATIDPFPRGEPEALGLSSAKLGRAVDTVQGWVDEGRIVGAIMLVIRHGRIVLHEAAGWSDREQGIPMRPDHVVSMRSMTKPLVGTAILMLEEEGRLRLNDRVSQYLPSFDNDRSREITIFQLLTHTSGLKGEIYNDHEGTPYASLREAVDAVGEKGPSFPPGTDYYYSDTGSSTLGALIAERSGMSAEAFIQQRILDPLQMEDSFLSLHPTDRRRPRIAAAYRREEGEWTKYWDNARPLIVPFFRASGGLYSSALDYARFMAAMVEGGSLGPVRLLPSAAVELAHQPHSAYVYSPEHQRDRDRFYGFHWTVFSDRYRPVAPPFSAGTFQHRGSDGTIAWADPKNGLIVVYLTQSRGTDTAEEFVRLVYDALMSGPSARPRQPALGESVAKSCAVALFGIRQDAPEGCSVRSFQLQLRGSAVP